MPLYTDSMTFRNWAHPVGRHFHLGATSHTGNTRSIQFAHMLCQLFRCVPGCCIPREVDRSTFGVLFHEQIQQPNHLTCILGLRVEMGDLFCTEFQCRCQDKLPLALLVLWNRTAFSWRHQRTPPNYLDGERPELVHGKESFIRLELREDACDAL